MHILTISLNYRRTPVHVRERFAINNEDLPAALTRLRQTRGVLECVLLSTCNRTEVFAVVDQLNRGRDHTLRFLEEWFQVEQSEFSHSVDFKENDQAIQHLFRLAVGLDSMVIGETQILGQLKQAFFIAQKAGTTGTIFNSLFKQVITMAKRAHAETKIGQHAVSVSYAAVELSRQIFGDLHEKTAVIIGAGKMSELTLKHLTEHGVDQIMVVNRTIERAKELSGKFSGEACAFDRLTEAVSEADIVISSTGAAGYVLSYDDIETVMAKRPHRPLFLIDIAVPRDLDPRIAEAEQVFLYDIDDLHGIVEANIKEREREAELVEVMINEECVQFKKWVRTLGVVPLITALQEKGTSIQQEAMRKIENKLPGLTEDELRLIRKYTKSIVNQMMHDPIVGIKEMAAQRGSKDALRYFADLFALEKELQMVEEAEQAQQLAENLRRTRQERQVNERRQGHLYGEGLPSQ